MNLKNVSKTKFYWEKKNNFKNEFLQTIFFTSKKLYFISKSYQVEDIIIYTNIIF